MKTNISELSINEFKELVESTVVNALHKKELVQSQTKLYSRNEARIKLHIGYKTLNTLIEIGRIKTTPDKKYIPEVELNNYLGNE